jgi:2-hydroxy-3-keto-5-methylthiopentenyl-1-phosphate phosphatase
MEPVIRHLLASLVGEEQAREIEIISNDVRVDADGRWHIQFRHPERSGFPALVRCFQSTDSVRQRSGFGHDKSQAILPYRDLPDPPILCFFGDGVSGLFIHIRRRIIL